VTPRLPTKRHWLRRILLGVAALVVVVPLAGWTCQQVMEARDDRRFPPPGKLVAVDGHRMHIHCQGHGAPAVIVEQGVGAQSLGWAPVNERLSTITTVCAYDRAGMGYSEPLDHPTPATEVARRLHALLEQTGLSDDIVLVGWSAGGMYSREYYRQFPAGVKGMVLVDSSHEQQLTRMGDPDVGYVNPLKMDRYLAPIGWIRLSGEIEERFAQSPLPLPIRERLIALNLKSRMPRTMLAEGDGFRADLTANRTPPSLGDLPLIVLSEGKPNIPFMQERIQTWFQLQEELAHLSTKGRHIVATQSAHAIHRTEPDLIFNAVQEVVMAARVAPE
jgi:pimeloyl-ACP methyl ester carboxylesterase